MKRSVFFISDGTGITAQTLGHSLLTQFENLEFEEHNLPYVDTPQKATQALQKIAEAKQRDGERPLVFATLIDTQIQNLISQSEGLVINFFGSFISPLEKELNCKSSYTVNRFHGVKNYKNYMTRMEAVNYTLAHDDGANLNDFELADLILVGVSRCGKTPTSLYLALQFGLFIANYPFTEDDMDALSLPSFLQQYRSKLFGLTIEPHRLNQIRNQRRPNSRYASLEQCELEVKTVEKLFQKIGLGYIDVTQRSIEEIATVILTQMNIQRPIY